MNGNLNTFRWTKIIQDHDIIRSEKYKPTYERSPIEDRVKFKEISANRLHSNELQFRDITPVRDFIQETKKPHLRLCVSKAVNKHLTLRRISYSHRFLLNSDLVTKSTDDSTEKQVMISIIIRKLVLVKRNISASFLETLHNIPKIFMILKFSTEKKT